MSKKVLSLILALAVVLTMFVLPAAASAGTVGYYAVYSHCPNGKPLNVRSGPGKDFPVIDKVPYGGVIYVVYPAVDGWLPLNDVGYVQAALTSQTYPGPYVAPDPSKKTTEPAADYNALFQSAKAVATPYLVTLKATANSKGVANVRWAPSKKATLLKAYDPGTQVLVLAEVGKNWLQVQDPITNAVGFVNTAYVD